MQRSENAPETAVQRQFGAIARAYAESPIHRGSPDLQALIDAAAFTPTDRVLDLGCGAGHTALAAARLAGEVVALDVTPEMLAVAQSLAEEAGLRNVSFRHGSATNLPFEDNSFDAVTTRYSAHHFDDPAAAVREAARILRPGGRLLLVDTVAPEDPALDTFNNAVELLRDPSHVRNCRVSEWLRLMTEAGLSTETVMQDTLDLEGESWVARSRTAPERVAALRRLFADATPAAQQEFALTNRDSWGWRIPIALFRATKPA